MLFKAFKKQSSLHLQATKLSCQMLSQEKSTVDRPESDSEDDSFADLAEKLWSYLETYSLCDSACVCVCVPTLFN